jgi:DNA-binding NarL/FixJ family response regulator
MADDRSTDGPIRVLLADDHTMFCQGLAAILTPYGGMEVVAETKSSSTSSTSERRSSMLALSIL